MGKVEEYQTKAFNAFHLERNRLQNDENIRTFVEKSGVDKVKFFGIYNSFAVQGKMSRASQLVTSYEIDSWPKLSIDGRYITAPSMAASTMGRVTELQQNQALFPVLDWLLAKVQKEKQVTPAVTTSAAAASVNKASKIKAAPNKK
jgi:protein dithiol oxidoreductase (disulfide-forming)